MPRLVILRHAKGNAEDDAHFDLLLERDSTDDRRALTFRLDRLVDLTAAAEFEGERIRDHRAVYFEYEGPVPAPGSGGPHDGEVTRVAAGRCEIHVATPDLLDVSIEIEGRPARFVGERIGGGGHDGLGLWRFNRC